MQVACEFCFSKEKIQFQQRFGKGTSDAERYVLDMFP